jgi:predicted acetyltransferase
MEIRRLEEAESAQAHYVWSQAFERGDREMQQWKEWEAQFPEDRITYGVWDSAGLQATVLIVGYQMHFGPDVVLPMGGVCGVACLPAARGRGYAGVGVKFALERMREVGQVISVLDPFHWGFYQGLGWDWIGGQRRYALPTRILPSDPETENVRAATLTDRQSIADLYRSFAHRYRGMLTRNDRDWGWILDDRPKEHTYTYVYEKDGRMEGYLTYRGGKREETRLREFITITARAQKALVGLLRRHAMQIEKVVWPAPLDDNLWCWFYHWDIETKIRPMTMGRIVDVPAALRLWKPGGLPNAEVLVAVIDENAPWNTRTWRIEMEAGVVEVRLTHADPQVAVDIRALSQAFFGTPTLDHLRASDRVSVSDETGYAALKALLDGPPMWINDDF